MPAFETLSQDFQHEPKALTAQAEPQACGAGTQKADFKWIGSALLPFLDRLPKVCQDWKHEGYYSTWTLNIQVRKRQTACTVLDSSSALSSSGELGR